MTAWGLLLLASLLAAGCACKGPAHAAVGGVPGRIEVVPDATTAGLDPKAGWTVTRPGEIH